jgi:hypothetical protein
MTWFSERRKGIAPFSKASFQPEQRLARAFVRNTQEFLLFTIIVSNSKFRLLGLGGVQRSG